MRKVLISLLTVLGTITAHAQLTDDFETNQQGWTEISVKDGEALIKEGVMHIKSRKSDKSVFSVLPESPSEPNFIETHCYAPFDPSKDFELKCEALAKKIDDNNTFGIVFDYIDEGNFMVFRITEGQAELLRFKEYKLIGRIRSNLKLKKQRKAALEFSIKNTFRKLEFGVNGMKIFEARYLPVNSMGIGFAVWGQQTVDFDNLIITQ